MISPTYRLPGLIKIRLKELKWSKANLARMIGVSQPSVSDWCSGKKYPSEAHIVALCKILGLDMCDVWNDIQAARTKAKGYGILTKKRDDQT